MEIISDLILNIAKHLVDEKLFKEEHTAEIFNLKPSDSFLTFINQLLLKFKR